MPLLDMSIVNSGEATAVSAQPLSHLEFFSPDLESLSAEGIIIKRSSTTNRMCYYIYINRRYYAPMNATR